MTHLPILYSFRRCPYAIRTRMTLAYSGITVNLREIILRDKPTALLDISPKGTVPVLLQPDQTVLDESLDIMRWALAVHDPDQWLRQDDTVLVETKLIETNDNDFKVHLDQYKYADRHPEQSTEYYRQQGEKFLQSLEQQLRQTQFLLADTIGLADIAIFPFIRQFAFVDKTWFDQSPYPQLQHWLDYFLRSPLFINVMKKYSVWQPGQGNQA